MQLIKKIISWLISLFHMLFKKNKNNSKIDLSKKNTTIKQNNKTKAVITETNETLPSYMYLSSHEKALLVNQIKNIKELIKKNSNDYITQEIIEMVSMIDSCITKDNADLNEIVNDFKTNISNGINKSTKKEFDRLVNVIPIEKKEVITEKYNSICSISNEIKDNINKVDKIINNIQERNITIVENNSLVELSDNYINNKNTNVIEKIDNYNEDMMYIMKNINKNVIEKVKVEYKKINYITLSTELLDEISEKLNKVEDNYNSHRYNKYYYEREINRIKKQILELKELKNKPQVYNEILKLRKELYTKSKDKYDILYNNEIFMNINKKCDDLINKVNAKVVDIKKDNKSEKKDVKKKNNEYLKNILLRFQDMNLARQIIMDMEQIKFENDNEMFLYINNMYDGFTTNGISSTFNFERNKEKTELVVLFNSLNKVNCYLKKEQYIPIEHINFRMNDLLDAVIVKKDDLRMTMKSKYNVDITNKLVDNRMTMLLKNEGIDSQKKLIKVNKKEE